MVATLIPVEINQQQNPHVVGMGLDFNVEKFNQLQMKKIRQGR